MLCIGPTDKNSAKFTMWLELDSLTEVKLKKDVIDAFGFLAHETIREVTVSYRYSCMHYNSHIRLFSCPLQIVELSLQVKDDMEHILLGPHIGNPRHHQPSLLGPIPPTSPQELSPSGTDRNIISITHFTTLPNCMPVQWTYYM